MIATADAGMVEITFADTRRPEDATHVRSNVFDGPLALLLSLIEQRQLDVLTVRLGDLAGAYLEALARIEDGRLPLLSSFVTICSQLILIKSRALLPRPIVAPAAVATVEGGDPEEELRQRLVEYRMYRDAGRALAERLAAGTSLFHREVEAAVAAGRAGARPEVLEPLDARLLADALVETSRLVLPPPPPPETIARTITLAERAAVIRSALGRAPVFVLQELLEGRPRSHRRRGHVPGAARDGQGPRGRHRAGSAVGADQRPSLHQGRNRVRSASDPRGTGPHRRARAWPRCSMRPSRKPPQG